MHFIQISFVSVNANLRLMEPAANRSPVVIYVSAVRDSRKSEHAHHRGCPMQIYGSRAPLLSRNPSAHRDSRKHLEARRGVQLTPPKRRVSSSGGGGGGGTHSRVKSTESTDTRGWRIHVERQDDVLLSLARKSCGHAPRMISRLVCRVRCTVCLCLQYL